MENNTFENNFNHFFFFERATSSGNMPDMHTHNSYEIFYLTSGERKYFIKDKYYMIKSGDVVCIPPNAPHKTGGCSGQRFLINFNDEFLSTYLTEQSKIALLSFFDRLFLRPAVQVQKTLLDTFNALQSAQKNGDNAKLISNLLKLFIILNDCPTLSEEDSFAIKQLHKAMNYVQSNFEHLTCLDDVANALFISKYYVCHLFSKYLEVPFVGYLNQIRLESAKNLLTKTNLSVAKIAIKCGFNSPAYFGAVFKKQFNLTPLNYRKLHGK